MEEAAGIATAEGIDLSDFDLAQGLEAFAKPQQKTGSVCCKISWQGDKPKLIRFVARL